MPDQTRPHPPDEPPSVAELMSRMAEGDTAAVFTLADQHGNRVAGVVRRELRRCGVDRVARDDLDGLVLDACMALLEVAGAWRPDGAQPWWWAQGRILGEVRRWVGVHADVLDEHERALDERVEVPLVAGVDEDIAATFARLVRDEPLVGLLPQACREAAVGEEAMFCLLEYRIQQDQGDPSPAHTLAPRYGVSPQTLRKRISRSTERLRRVVDDDPRYASLVDFVLVA